MRNSDLPERDACAVNNPGPYLLARNYILRKWGYSDTRRFCDHPCSQKFPATGKNPNLRSRQSHPLQARPPTTTRTPFTLTNSFPDKPKPQFTLSSVSSPSPDRSQLRTTPLHLPHRPCSAFFFSSHNFSKYGFFISAINAIA